MGDAERGIRGRVVAEAWLQLLEGDEREIVLEELDRRQQGFRPKEMGPAGQSTTSAPVYSGAHKSPKRGPYKNGGGKSKGDEPEPLVGEEQTEEALEEA